MTEEPEQYQWETEDGTGTAVVSDAPPAMRDELREVLAEIAKDIGGLFGRVQKLEGAVESIDKTGEQFDAALRDLARQLNRIQDANIAPMLESSAVIVELTRIADYLDGGDGGVLLGVTAGLNRIADAMEAWNIPTPCDYDDDCDELWRLARDLVFAAKGQETALRYDALDIYVREHTP